jgi:hypothetical protein
MAKVAAKRVTAKIEGDFVVFLIDMRINKPWKLHKWLPVFQAMPRMIRELERHPESGFLGHIMSLGVIVQYWRSFEHLEAYARDANQLHWPALGGLQQECGQESRRRGHLARDLPSPRRRIRVRVQRNATVRSREGQRDSRRGRKDGVGARTARSHRVDGP